MDIHCENLNALPIEAKTGIQLMMPFKLKYD